jgi:FMN-dependent NADH-azoreductase
MASKLLVVETSSRGDSSVSRQLTRRFVTNWQATHPQGDVVVRDLANMQLPHVNAPWLQAYFTSEDKQSAEMKEVLRMSDALVAEIFAADHIVIATPVYNYNVPSALKAWVDNIVRKGKTLSVSGVGLVTGKKATVLLASGGVYTEGSPIRDRNIAEQYLRLILNVIGITDVTVVAGGAAKLVDMGEETMAGFVAKHGPAIEEAAAKAG